MPLQGLPFLHDEARVISLSLHHPRLSSPKKTVSLNLPVIALSSFKPLFLSLLQEDLCDALKWNSSLRATAVLRNCLINLFYDHLTHSRLSCTIFRVGNDIDAY